MAEPARWLSLSKPRTGHILYPLPALRQAQGSDYFGGCTFPVAELVEATPYRDGLFPTHCSALRQAQGSEYSGDRASPVAELVEATGLLGRILCLDRIPRHAAGDASGEDVNA